MDLATYLDEDQYLDQAEMGHAILQHMMMDFNNSENDYIWWLTDTFSSTASDKEAGSKMTKEGFINFMKKLGVTKEKAKKAFEKFDLDKDKLLDILEQDGIWKDLMN